MAGETAHRHGFIVGLAIWLVFRDALEHWRHFEPWLEPLKAALGPVLETYPRPPGIEMY